MREMPARRSCWAVATGRPWLLPTSPDPSTAAAAVAGLGPPGEALAIFLVPDDQPQTTHFLIQRTCSQEGLVLGGGCLLSLWLYPESTPCLKELTSEWSKSSVFILSSLVFV